MAGAHVVLHLVVAGKGIGAFIPYTPPHEVELTLELTEQLTGTLVHNLLEEFSPVAELIVIKTCAALYHVEVLYSLVGIGLLQAVMTRP